MEGTKAVKPQEGAEVFQSNELEGRWEFKRRNWAKTCLVMFSEKSRLWTDVKPPKNTN